MQQRFISQDNTMISERQKRVMGISSGLLLAAIEIAFLLNETYFRIYYFQMDFIVWIGIIALLYFVAPIPLSFYISRQTISATEGWKGGRVTGCTGALLTTLSAVIYYIWLVASASLGRWGFLIFVLLIIFAFLHGIGALISLLGAVIGSRLGQMGKYTV